MVLVSGFADGIQSKRSELSSGSRGNKFCGLPQHIGAEQVAKLSPSLVRSGIQRAFSAIATNTKETSMSDQTPVLKTTTDDIPHEVLELADAIHALPPEQRQSIEPLLGRVVDSSRRRRRILLLVQDALSQLRLDMKYLTFDLEATRRERDELRRKRDETA
jgi:hypothetical protein